ncbi:MAG TPA: TIM barrel protein [Streptosporangiaceae bacterium]|jgi:4-hydroxyphenylpyruvate dioxygenase
MRKSIATVSVSGTLPEKLAAIAQARFQGVEIFESDLVNAPVPAERIRWQAADLGLAIELYQPLRDFEAMPPHRFAANLKRAERKFDVMERLGADTMLVCSNVSPAAIDDDALAAEHLHALAGRAAARGMRIAYEALAWGRHVDDYQHSWEIVRAAGHPALGVCLDSFHILSRGPDPAGIRRLPADRIFFLQLADAPVLAMDVLPWSRHYRCFPGQGGFDLPGFLGHVLAAGYRGPLSLEVFSDTFRQAEPEATALDAMRSLLYLEESLRARWPGGEPLELFAPPPAPAPSPAGQPAASRSGLAFAEIAAAAADAPALAGTLRTLGFTRAGVHRTKNAALWRHGGAHLVLNTDPAGSISPDGFRRDPQLTALGLRTTDSAALADRAEQYLAPVLPRRRGRGEADLPSVRTPAGTTLLFCQHDDEWLGDFAGAVPAAPGPRTGPGQLTGIDHVALAAPFDRFDDSVLFLRAVLGLEPGDDLELAHPQGLVRSRVLSSAGGPAGGVRIALNMPPLGGRAGPAAQHVAFSCDDVFAVRAALRAAGAALLAIPENYYEDLQARLDLDERTVTRLLDSGMLYDRDARGEFFHFYTAPLGLRLFIEVVQRCGGYAGYGAVNAPTRMAAQRTFLTAGGRTP